LEADVPLYLAPLGRFKYSAEAIKAMIENPHDRGAVAAEAAESLGCKLHGMWWALGEHDGVFLLVEVAFGRTRMGEIPEAG
jgi:uncharacterized protein with GYD domain